MSCDHDHVHIRAFEPGDAERLVRMFERLSRTSVYRRFFTLFSRLDGPLLAHLTAIDHLDHESVVAAVGDEIVAVANYDRRVDDPRTAELSVLVEDDCQRHGLARKLLRQVTWLARDRGVSSLTVTMLTENQPALGLLRSIVPNVTLVRDGPEVRAVMPLRPRRATPGASRETAPMVATSA